jgi:hypothetical protein
MQEACSAGYRKPYCQRQERLRSAPPGVDHHQALGRKDRIEQQLPLGDFHRHEVVNTEGRKSVLKLLVITRGHW